MRGPVADGGDRDHRCGHGRSLLLACGLRLHRCSDRAVAGVAVAGLRPARRRCPAASPRPCLRSSSRLPPAPAGPRSCDRVTGSIQHGPL